MSLSRRIGAAMVLALGFTCGVTAQAPATQVVGFVEDIPSTADEAQPAGPGQPHRLEQHVRVAFARTPDGWKPACTYGEGESDTAECLDLGLIRRLPWHVAHRGKRLGGIETDRWYDARYYRTLGVLRRTSEPAPRVGKPDARFASWLAPAAHRPLVALREPKFSAPAAWSESRPSTADLDIAVATFRRAIKYLPDCGAPGAQPERPIERGHLEVSASLRAKDGARLVGVRLDPKLARGCTDAPGLEWSDLWFHAPAGKPPALLQVEIDTDLAPFRMVLLDAGDYDGDGKPEFAFWFSSHSTEGYLLFHDDFSSHTRFAWKYQ